MANLPLIRVSLAAACAVGGLSAQNDAEAGRRSNGTASPSAVSPAPRTTAPKSVAPALPEHGFLNDVEADKVLGSRSPKPISDKPDNGIPVVVAPHGQCRFAVSIAPAKLMAGQAGTVSIVMILEADSVMESATDLRIGYHDAEAAAKSLLQLGAAQIVAPRPAQLATAYRGRLVYDNWAKIELPIAMAAEAPLGSIQTIDVDAQFRLHDGSTGALFGEYCNTLTIACEVGLVRDPAVRTTLRTDTTARDGDQHVVPGNERLPQAEPSIAADGTDPTVHPGRTAPRVPEPSDGNEPYWFLLLGCGVLVAGLLLLFVRRR